MSFRSLYDRTQESSPLRLIQPLPWPEGHPVKIQHSKHILALYSFSHVAHDRLTASAPKEYNIAAWQVSISRSRTLGVLQESYRGPYLIRMLRCCWMLKSEAKVEVSPGDEEARTLPDIG